MNSLELTRLGIILTMTSVLFISPEVFYRARKLAWINSIFEWIKSSVSDVRSHTIKYVSDTHRAEVREQLDKALKSGKPTRLLVRLTFSNLVPLISLITLILYIFCHLHVSVGIIAGIFTAFYIFVSVYDVFASHQMDKQRGEVIPFMTNITEHFTLPPIIYLYLCSAGILWLIVITAILSSSKSVRSWLAIIGILMFFAGQTLQLVATFS